MDFAFFVVNFGYSKQDYLSLTPRERSFIIKAYETKQVSESTLMERCVENALGNYFRKRSQPYRELWKKRSKEFENADRMIRDIEKLNAEDTSWVDRIYEQAGRRRPQ